MKNAFVRMVALLLSSSIGFSGPAMTPAHATDSGPGTPCPAVQDANAEASPDLMRIEFNMPCPTITISPGTLPEPIRGVPYSQALNATGGTVPYTFSVAFGAMPGGITLSTAGLISGTATNYGVSTFGVFATDATGCSRLTNYTMEVQPNRWVGDGAANLWDLATGNWRQGLFQNGQDVSFDDTGSNNVPVNIGVLVSPGSISVNATQTYLFNGSGGITGTGGLIKANSGELVLSTSNSFSGTTRVQAGTLTLQHNLALGMTSGGTVVNGTNAGVRVEGNGLNIAEPLTIDVPSFFDSSATNGALVNLGQTNTWSGRITLAQADRDGPVAIRSMAGQLTLNSPTPIAGPGHLNVRGDGDVVIQSGIHSSVGSLSKSGSGILWLQGTNASGGPINVSQGKVSAVAAALGSGSIWTQLEGTFEIDVVVGNITVNNPIRLSGGKLRVRGSAVIGAAAEVDNGYGGAIEAALASDRLVFNTPIRQFGLSCCGTLTISGPGTVVLNSGLTPQQNGFLGYWELRTGMFVLNHINALSQAGTVTLGDGGTIRTGVDGGGSFAYSLGAVNGAYRPGRGTPGAGVSNYLGILRLGQLAVTPGSNLVAGSTADLVCGEVQLFNHGVLSVEKQNGVNARVTVMGLVRQEFGDPFIPYSLTKVGAGTLVLAGDSFYFGGTVVSNGTLRVANATGSATGPGALRVLDHASLVGTGRIAGAVTIRAGGTLAPGDSIGTLTISNHLVMEAGATNAMEVNRSTFLNDRIIGLSNITYGGTLRLTRLGAAPYANGDAIKLFDAATYSGAFASVEPPSPGTGIQWDTSTMTADGTLRVMTAVTPAPFALTNPAVLPGGAFQFGFANVPGAVFTALAATNLSLPLSNWPPLGPVTEVMPGHYQFTDPEATNVTRRYYGVRSP